MTAEGFAGSSTSCRARPRVQPSGSSMQIPSLGQGVVSGTRQAILVLGDGWATGSDRVVEDEACVAQVIEHVSGTKVPGFPTSSFGGLRVGSWWPRGGGCGLGFSNTSSTRG
eukprot:6271444-Alexandrium_andersonii.AAC.1